MDGDWVEDGRLFYSLSFESACGLKYRAIDVNHRGRMFDRQTFGLDVWPTDIWPTDNCVGRQTSEYHEYTTFECQRVLSRNKTHFSS